MLMEIHQHPTTQQWLKIIELLSRGESIMLTQDQTPIAEVTPVKQAKPKYRQAGTMKGMIWMSDDFDEPLEDFKEYM